MSTQLEQFLNEHAEVTRRWFLRTGVGTVAAMSAWPLDAKGQTDSPELKRALQQLESYLTLPAEFRDVSRGNPKPFSLPDEKKKEVGLTRETWRLEVISDPEHPSRVDNEMTKANGKALDFAGLMQLAKKHAVRFPKVMTCLNVGRPLGMGIWEGVPLREVLWLAAPQADLRRVFYYGYHNDDPKQMFRSSLPVGRILEDLYDLPPITLCYKLNGQWLTSLRGGPVRVIVPEGYGFKSIKWLTTVVLSNIHNANDTYAGGNNDLDSPLKTFAATLQVPEKVKPDAPFAVTGYAQVGISGLSKVQVWIQKDGDAAPADDRYFSDAPWVDATVLPPPKKWGGGLPDDRIPVPTIGFDGTTGRPKRWPLRLTKAHWAVLIPGIEAGSYTLRSRTIDAKGHGQPMPRPFRKSGRAAIEKVPIKVRA